MVPTCCEISSQSPWVTPSGLSMEMRTKRCGPPPFTSTSTTSMPSDSATRCAISSILDAIESAIVPLCEIQQKSGLSPTRLVRHLQPHCTGFSREWKRDSCGSDLVVAVAGTLEGVDEGAEGGLGEGL